MTTPLVVSITPSWFRNELRHRWRSIALLGILAGLTAGLAMAAVDGAQRTGTVLDRVSAETLQPDVLVLPSRPESKFPYWPEIARLPEVASLGLFGVTTMGAIDVGEPGQLSGFPTANRALGSSVDVARIDEGRAIDPDRPDEVVITRAAAVQLHLEVGQTFTLAGETPEQIDADYAGTGDGPTPPAGPKVTVTIVGISDHPSLWGRYIGDSGRVDDPTSVGFLTSPALVEQNSYGYLPNALVRLRGGSADVAAFRADVARITGDPTVPVRDLAEDRARFGRTLSLERSALLLFAAAVALAGIVLLGQAVARLIQASSEDAGVLGLLGVSRSEITIIAASPALAVAALASVIAAAATTVFSTRFPIGLARSLDSRLGVSVSPMILGAGLLVVVAMILLGGVVSARSITRNRTVANRRGVMGRLVDGLRLPLPVELGTRTAVERGSNGGSVRPALVAAVVGVLAIIGAFTFRQGLDHAVGNFDLAGTTWQRVAYVRGSPDGSTPPEPVPSLDGVPGLRAAAEVTRSGVTIGGDTVSAWTYDPLVGSLRRVTTSGRLPDGPDEATLGTQTAAAIGAGVGDSVEANGHALKVVGVGFLPEQPGHSAYDQGLWVTPETMDRLQVAEIDDREVLADFGVPIHFPATVEELSGADPQSKALAAALGPLGVGTQPATPPSAMTNLGSVRGLPLALGIFLVVLAIGALAHTLVTSVSRRRRDLAVLRALGTTPGQTRTMVAAHATTVGVVGLVIGIPLGLVAGRQLWRWVATSVPFLYVGPIAGLAALAAVPVALLIANVVAAGPGRSAALIRPAEELRSE